MHSVKGQGGQLCDLCDLPGEGLQGRGGGKGSGQEDSRRGRASVLGKADSHSCEVI